MGRMKYEWEFPCGLKIKVDSSGWFMTGHYDDNDLKCPLHGKDCPNKCKRN